MMTAPAPARDGGVVPIWLSRLAALGWRLLAVIALGYVLVTTAVVLGTVTATTFVALLASAALLPVVRRLRARGVGRGIAAVLATLLGVALLIVTVLILALAVVPHVAELISAVREGVRDLREWLVAVGAPEFLLAAFDRLMLSVIAILRVDPVALAGPAVTVGTVLILSSFLTIFLLSDGDRGWRRVTGSMDPAHAAALTASATSGLDRVSGYLRRTALLAVIDAIVVYATLLVLGVPLAAPLSMLVFISGFVPYIGAIASTTVVGLVTLAFVGPIPSLVVLAAIVVASVVSGRLLANTGLGTAVDVHPLLVLVAIPTGAALFGLLGLIGLLPVIVFILAVAKSIIVVLSVQEAEPQRTDGVVPRWLDRLAQWSWRGLVAAGLVWVLIEITVSIPGVIVPVVLALVLAATLAPLASRLRQMGLGRGGAAAASTVGVALVVAATVAIAVVWTVGPMRELVATAVDGAEEIHIQEVLDAVESVGGSILATAAAVLGALPRLLLILVLAPLIAFFLLRDAGTLWRDGISGVVAHRRERLDTIGGRSVGVLGGYMLGTALISLFGAVTSALIMIILGLPLAIPIGILTFFGGFIPYLGSAVTTLLAVLVALAVGTTTDVVVMMIWTIVFNIVQGNFVTPIVYGRAFSLHPAFILLAIPAGGELAGVLGMFLVVPFVAIIAAIWQPALDLLEADPMASG
jgi:predicted PurR-regulated permease PerM